MGALLLSATCLFAEPREHIEVSESESSQSLCAGTGGPPNRRCKQIVSVQCGKYGYIIK